mgnify:CR=1 FL=1
MLLVTSNDKTASIWKVPSNATWPTTPHVTLKGHTNALYGGAFLGDESHVITASEDKSLLIWRTSDGVKSANYECSGGVCNLLVYYYHLPRLYRFMRCRFMLCLVSLSLVSMMAKLKCGKLLLILHPILASQFRHAFASSRRTHGHK